MLNSSRISWARDDAAAFHAAHKTLFALSNMHVHEFEHPDIVIAEDGTERVLVCAGTARSVENVFQAAKASFVGKAAKSAKIYGCPSPKRCKSMAGKINMPMSFAELRQWERESKDVMVQIVSAKFKVPELAETLLSTGELILVHKPPRSTDRKWGVCANWFGRNLLGQMLMTVRNDLNTFFAVSGM